MFFFVTICENFESSKHLSWWRRLEDVFHFLLKTSSSGQIYSPYSYLFRRRLQDVLINTNIFVLVIRLQDVLKTFSRRLQNVFKTSSRRLTKRFSRNLQDVLKTFSRRLQRKDFPSSQTFLMRLQYVLAIHLPKTPSRLLEDVLKTCLQDVFKVFSRRLQEVFQDVLKTFSRIFSRGLQDVLEDKRVLHWRRLKYAFTKTNVCWEVQLISRTKKLELTSINVE